MNQAAPSASRTLACRDRHIALGGEPVIMGIVNVTPDSFYADSRQPTAENAIAQARRQIAEGAGMLDLGGQSTRPGYQEITAEAELARVLPILEALVSSTNIPLSIDTYKPTVARATLQAGAHVLNDIHGLQRSPELAAIAAEFGCAVIVMHNDAEFISWAGDPLDPMQRYFETSLRIAEQAGLAREKIILDPGIGFAKTPDQNLALIGRMSELRHFGCPLLLGASRKSTLGRVLGGLPAEERLEATLATTALAVAQGVEFIRVHDVQPNLRAAKIAQAIRQASFRS